jgi:hypothetical protein
MNRIEFNPDDDGHHGSTALITRHPGGVAPVYPFAYPGTSPFAHAQMGNVPGPYPNLAHIPPPGSLPFNGPPFVGYAGDTYQPRAPGSRRQNRPVEVHCGPNTYYHCNRDDLLYHFPALRQEPFGRKLHPMQYVRPDNQRESPAVALAHIFRGLEAYRNTGQPLDIFARADDLLERTSDSRRGFLDVYKFFIGVCVACAKEGGLGCSEEILRQVDDFAVGLAELWEESLPPLVIRNVVLAYSLVFRPPPPRATSRPCAASGPRSPPWSAPQSPSSSSACRGSRRRRRAARRSTER